MTVAIFRAEDVFASELREAERRGFALRVGIGRVGVRAGLFPVTDGARAACALIAVASFEARCPVREGVDGLDVLRETIRAVLDHAWTELA